MYTNIGYKHKNCYLQIYEINHNILTLKQIINNQTLELKYKIL